MSVDKEDGGPAFPMPKTSLMRDHVREPHRFTHDIKGDDGMSLRDYFAAQALIGMTANPDTFKHEKGNGSELRSRLSGACYAIADAMLEARK